MSVQHPPPHTHTSLCPPKDANATLKGVERQLPGELIC